MRINHASEKHVKMACYLHQKMMYILGKFTMSDENSFQIVNFGADLLGSYYSARQQTRSLQTLPSVPSNVSLGNTNSAITPWEQDNAVERERLSENLSSNALYKLLKKDYSSIQNKDEFINRVNNLVRDADLDIDSKGLFALYNALKDLKTIAEYAGDPRTSDRKMAALEEQFRLGFSQVKDFINTEKFDELTLLYGEKSGGLVARAGLGKKEYDFVGPVIHEGKVDDPISELVGGETFTITITRKKITSGVITETTENFNITVPLAEDERTFEVLTAQINNRIQAIKTTDDEGEEIPLFQTRFFAEEVEPDKFAFRIKTNFSEKLSFAAADTEPALYITGNVNTIDLTTKLVDNDRSRQPLLLPSFPIWQMYRQITIFINHFFPMLGKHYLFPKKAHQQQIMTRYWVLQKQQ